MSMIVSCAKCGKPYDTQDGNSEGVCRSCIHIAEQTMSDIGSVTPSDPLDLSVTGLHEDSSKRSPKRSSSDRLGEEFGDYKIVRKLGRGGMGMVFLAMQRNTDRKVALKVIRDDRLNDIDSTLAREWVARFKSEAQAAARLEHENIVTVYEVGQLEGNHFFSMQFVDGKTLAQIAAKASTFRQRNCPVYGSRLSSVTTCSQSRDSSPGHQAGQYHGRSTRPNVLDRLWFGQVV